MPEPTINAEILVQALAALAETKSAPGVTIHEIRKHTGWGRCKTYRTLGLAVELGILTAEWTMKPSRITGRPAQAVVYRLVEQKGGSGCSKTSASTTRSCPRPKTPRTGPR